MSNNQTTTISSTSSVKKGSSLGGIAGFILGIVITVGAGYMLFQSGLASPIFPTKNSQNIDDGIPTESSKWKLPVSTKQGYPMVTAGNNPMMIFDISTKKIKDTKTTVSCCGGAMYLGDIDPKPSPNLLYTSFIDPNSKALWVMSNENLEKVQIPNSEGVTYITGWSPSGNVLVYYFTPQTLMSKKDGYMTEWDTVEKFERNVKSGFYAFNIKTGVETSMYPVQVVVGVISDDEVLAKTTEDNNRIVIFDHKNYIADYAASKGDFTFGTGQFDISNDGTKWVFSSSKNPTEDMYIEIAELPQKEGTTIDTGKWADVQWPKISANGDLVAYQRYEGVIDTGIPNPTLWIYDGKSGAEENPKKVGSGRPLAWVNEDTLVVEVLEKNEDKVVAIKGLFKLSDNTFTPFE